MEQHTEQADITDQLLEVKKILGKNYRQKIADRTGFSTRRVSQVFEAEDLRHEIIQEAIVMAIEIKEMQAGTTAKLGSL